MPAINYEIHPAAEGQPLDDDLERLLERVYVDEGFADPEVAKTMFDAKAVRARGQLYIAVLTESRMVIGTVIVVPPTSSARKLAGPTDAELHLLAVLPEYRGIGVGRRLTAKALQEARDAGYKRMLLWSQPNMTIAHHLYRSAGFVRTPERDFDTDGRDFWVFQTDL